MGHQKEGLDRLIRRLGNARQLAQVMVQRITGPARLIQVDDRIHARRRPAPFPRGLQVERNGHG
jgi:hypothetical protein